MPPDLFFDNVFICFFSPEKSPYYTFANAKKQVDNLKNLFPQNMRLYVKIIYGAAHGDLSCYYSDILLQNKKYGIFSHLGIDTMLWT